jgi:hypothetical protein
LADGHDCELRIVRKPHLFMHGQMPEDKIEPFDPPMECSHASTSEPPSHTRQEVGAADTAH